MSLRALKCVGVCLCKYQSISWEHFYLFFIYYLLQVRPSIQCVHVDGGIVSSESLCGAQCDASDSTSL